MIPVLFDSIEGMVFEIGNMAFQENLVVLGAFLLVMFGAMMFYWRVPKTVTLAMGAVIVYFLAITFQGVFNYLFLWVVAIIAGVTILGLFRKAKD